MPTERWTDEMLDELASDMRELTGNVQALLRIAQIHQESLEGMRAQMTAAINELRQNVTELRAGQERQAAILDYLIRRGGQSGDRDQDR
jgi:ElaB/YqjD/DUF883 family membrane-anchored ribosome-binding protein